MEITVNRTIFNDTCTLGEMMVDDTHFAYTLEPFWRGDVTNNPELKVWGKTAIPCGTYECKVSYSPHFKRDLVHVLNVPQFDQIMIHGLNHVNETHGCCGVGENTNNVDTISNCKPVVDKVVELVQTACKTGKVFITYSNIPQIA